MLMKIGLSLPVDYLAGIDRSVDSQILQASFGSPEECLEELKKLDVISIELRSVTNSMEMEIVARAAEKVWEQEMLVTVHGELPEGQLKNKFLDNFPSWRKLFETLPDTQDYLLVTVHCYKHESEKSEQLCDKTIVVMKRLNEMLDDERLKVKFALELNRKKKSNDPGTDYNMLVSMCKRIASPGIGICWDIGHAYANFIKDSQNKWSPDFIDRVIHVHLHGIDGSGRTHRALTDESLPLDKFVKPLVLSQNYSGVFNLELKPKVLQDNGDVREQFIDSIMRLREYFTN